MTRIDIVLMILLLCLVGTLTLLVLRRCVTWAPTRPYFNIGLGAIILFVAFLFLMFTFGHNSYDQAFNQAFAHYFNVPAEDTRAALAQEARRKSTDETLESIAAGAVLVICALATYLTRNRRPKGEPESINDAN